MRWFWIDRFTEFVCDSHAVAVKGVSLAEPHMHDHFVGYPIMPNSLVTEGIAQAGGLLVSEHYGFAELVVLAKGGVGEVSFHRPQWRDAHLSGDGRHVAARWSGDFRDRTCRGAFARGSPTVFCPFG